MITVMTCTNKQGMMENIFLNYSNQTMQNKELIIILNRDDLDLSVWQAKAKQYPSVSVYQIPEKKMVSDCKNDAIQKAAYDHIAKFDDDDYYAPSYLQTAWAAFSNQPEADIVGKSCVYYYFQERRLLCLFPSSKENTWTNRVADSTLVFKKKLFNDVCFRREKVGSDKNFQKDCLAAGYNIYTTDRYNHVIMRRNDQHHTWKIWDQPFIAMCDDKVYTDDYQSIVTT